MGNVVDTGLTRISLQEAAAQLGVHYMTAYRYMRQGQLHATKVGGVWQVDIADLDQFKAAQAAPPVASGPGSGRKSAPWSQRLEARLLAGDGTGAWSVVESAIDSGTDVDEVYLDVIAPALVSIGAQWKRGEIDIFVEHRATGIATRLVGQLGARCARRGRTKGTVVLGGPQGETHALAVSMLADVIRLSGYEVFDLGADTPADSFVSAVRNVDSLVAVGVSCFTDLSKDSAQEAIASLREVIDESVVVFLGGASIPDLETAQSLGADEWARDARDFVETLERVLKDRNKQRAG